MKKGIVKASKISGIVLIILLILLLSLGYFFSRYFNEQVKRYANEHLKSELNFSDTKLSFFNHFPTLTFTLYDFSLKGARPFEKDTLLASNEIALGIDLSSLFSGKMKVNKIFLTEASINIKVTEEGKANYDIYDSSDSSQTSDSDSTADTDLEIENIIVENSNIAYEDLSFPMLFRARGFEYTGKGDLSQSLFDLASNMKIAAFDFNYDNQYYFESKKIQAELLTGINTRSLSILFKKNDIKINNLPLAFTGVFEFLKNGYSMDFNIQSVNTSLKDVITAMPKDYMQWMSQTDLKGDADIKARLHGDYVADKEAKPDLSLDMQVRNGYVSYDKAPKPVSDIYIDFHAGVPALNPDSVEVLLDSVSFRMDRDYFGAMLRLKGMEAPRIQSRVNTEINIGNFFRAVGLQDFDIKGQFSLHGSADGVFAQGQNPASKVPDTIITSIPRFAIQSMVRNGYFNNTSTPEPVRNISFDMSARCDVPDYKKTNLSVENLNADFLNSSIKGFFKLKGGEPLQIDAALQSSLELSAIDRILTLDSMDVKGKLTMDVAAKGRLDYDRKVYPSLRAKVQLTKGSLQTKYYPQPLENIEVDASVSALDGSMQKARIVLKSLSFLFEKQRVDLRMDLFNFEDVKYDVSAKGSVDLGHLSKVFPQDGLDAEGFIKANVSLRGLQSDVTAGRYERLHNTGGFQIRDIQLSSSYFPLPFHINNGSFSFRQDSLMMDDVTCNYGHSDLHLSGRIENVLNYYLKNEPLRGRFYLKSHYLDVNEFMSDGNQPTASSASSTSTSSGVVIIPKEYDISIQAGIGKVKFGTMDISDAKAGIAVEDGTLKIIESGFTLIDAPVVMNASYSSINEQRAMFDYHISAQSFDIKKAYDEVPVFRELVTSAAKVRGIISLDYSLKGKLNAGMQPVYPSLEGGGTLSILKAQMKGYKLFSALSKEAGKDSLNNPDLSNVDIKTTIKNNIITLLPVKMRIAGFRPRVQGETTFDGKINLKVRLGLPPLGIVGIPINVTGTQEKPMVKLGRGKNNEPLTETIDDAD